MAGGFGVVEVAFIVGLQPHRKFMEVLGDLVVVVEALDDIDHIVVIDIVKSGELIAASDVDFFVYDLETKWLEEPRANAFPRESAFELVDTFDDPDVSHPGADSCAFSIGIEIKSTRAHPGAVGVDVSIGNGEDIDSEGAGFVATFDFGGDGNGGFLDDRLTKDRVAGNRFDGDLAIGLNPIRNADGLVGEFNFVAQGTVLNCKFGIGGRATMPCEPDLD